MKLNFAMIGGGGGFIGNVHRTGATIDNKARLVAGCFSRNEDRNKEYAELWDVSPERTYKDYKELIISESKRDDKVDFIVIVTPNITHYEIAKMCLEYDFDIVCDKPVTIKLEDSLELKKMVEKKDKLFGVTYTYANYAMVKEAQQIIKNGEIGNIVNIMAEYPQDWAYIEMQEPDYMERVWRFNREQSGDSAATADIGTHLIQVIATMTGLKLETVLANFNRIPETMDLETNTQVLLKYENNIPGMLWASQVAIGHECDVNVRIFGDKGSVSWNHNKPYELKVTKLDGPIQYYTCNRNFLYPDAKKMSRLPAGHPEGFFEAFGNFYKDYCTHLMEIKQGLPVTEHGYQNIDDGIEGLKFVESCIESDKNNNIWVNLD